MCGLERGEKWVVRCESPYVLAIELHLACKILRRPFELARG